MDREYIGPLEKVCGRCQQTLPVTSFAKNSAKPDGLQERCRECRAEHHQQTKHLRPKPSKESKRKWLVTSYGITQEQFEQMLAAQNHTCAICNSPDWGKPSPSIDHCHDTGKVRGLLCNNCNLGIGLLGDNWQTLSNALNYLERFESERE
jgi:hypothetical protein